MVASSALFDSDAYVGATRVHRAVYVDATIFETELRRIFERTWIYIAHESQVPKPGDFYATRVGRHPVVLVRGADGRLRVFFNRCTHKGTQLLGEGCGNAPGALRCPYHGWIFGLDGALRTVTARSGYAEGTVRAGAAEFALRQVADTDHYRGFVFARISGQGPALLDWLGPLAGSLDNFVERAPEGEVEVTGGVLRYEHACNWKFFTENTLDALHPMVVHNSATRSARAVTAEASTAANASVAAFEIQALAPFAGSYTFYDDMGARALPNGHADLGGAASIHSGYDDDPQYMRAMIDAHGEQRAREILALSRNNSLAYPSLMFKAPIQLLRVVRPLAVDRTLIETWHFRLKGAPPSILARTLAYSTLVNSSSGMVGPDDHQVYRQLQSGLATSEVEWVDMSRYANGGETQSDGSVTVKGTSGCLRCSISPGCFNGTHAIPT
jgi:phenylpropionate dioxygenase-like ring-hydroxylating dioxygenase large terminal subunit